MRLEINHKWLGTDGDIMTAMTHCDTCKQENNHIANIHVMYSENYPK